MAQKPLRPCRKPGCPNLTRDGWCPGHRPRPAQRRASGGWHWMYLTPAWREELRPAQLLREPFCRVCAARGERVRATVVDHIRPHRGDWELFIDPANHQSLCKRCHDQKTAREEWERKKQQKV